MGRLMHLCSLLAAGVPPSDYNSPPCFTQQEREQVLGLTNEFKKEDLRNLVSTKHGMEGPLRMQLLNWVSSELTAEVLNVILREVMAVNTTYESDAASSSANGLRALLGCPYPQAPQTCEGDASLDAGRYTQGPHVVTEIWAMYSKVLVDTIAADQKFEEKPVKAGVLGYKGREGTFLSQARIAEEALEQNRILQWYEGLNDRLGDTTMFMDDVQDVIDRFGLENLVDCHDAKVFYMREGASDFKKYFAAEDPDAFEEIDGAVFPKCGEPYAGKVWTSKRARERYAQHQRDGTTGKWCVPFITTSGFGTVQFLQQAHIWNISACVMNLNGDHYAETANHFRSLVNWWWPDTTFVAQDPVGVVGLPQDEIQHAEGYYLTPADATECYLYTNPVLQDVDDLGAPILLFLQKARIQTTDMSRMLNLYTSGSSAAGAACAWMKENDYGNIKRVLGWVPVQCEPGQQEVSGACEPCAPGTYSTGGFSARCVPCIPGFYQDMTGQTECQPCAAGFIQPLPGQAACTEECAAGFFSQRGSAECTPCEPGSFSDAAAQGECRPCAAGHAQAEAGKTECSACLSGTFAAEAGVSACVPCRPGTFTDRQGQKECVVCPAGQAQPLEGQQSCENCTAGFYRLADDEESAACRPCPKGYHAADDGRQQECNRCPQGTFSSGLNTTECTPCAPRRVTPFQGSVSAMDCVCMLGYFERPDQECEKCPPGTVCEDLDRKVPGQAAGFYVTNSSGSFEAFRCIEEAACVASDDLTGRCAENRDEDVLVCARCVPGYSRWKNSCNKCGSGAEAALVFLLLVFLAMMIATYYVCNSAVTRDASSLLATSVSFGMILTAVQSLSIVGQISVSWSSPWSDVIKVLKFMAFDLELLQMECLSDSISPVVRYLGRVIIPVLVAALYLILFAGSRVVLPRLKRSSWEWTKTVNSAAQVWQALYISIVLVAFLPFQCYEHPNGDSSVTEMPEVVCGEGDHGTMAGLGVVFIVVYGVGFFGACLWANIVAPSRSLRSPAFTMYTRFLYYRFRSDCWYWGSVLMVRSFLIALVPIVAPDNGNVQVLMLICVVGVSMLLQAHVLPWKTYLLNSADTAVLLMLLVIAGAASAFTRQEESQSGFTAFILVAFCVGFFTVVVVLVHGVVGACRQARGGGPPQGREVERLQQDFVASLKMLNLLTSESAERLVGGLGYFDRVAVRKFVGVMSHELQMGIRSSSKRISVSAGNLQEVRVQLQKAQSSTANTGEPKCVDL